MAIQKTTGICVFSNYFINGKSRLFFSEILSTTSVDPAVTSGISANTLQMLKDVHLRTLQVMDRPVLVASMDAWLNASDDNQTDAEIWDALFLNGVPQDDVEVFTEAFTYPEQPQTRE